MLLLTTTTTTYQQRKWRAAPIKKFGSQIVIIHKNRFPAMFDDDMCAVNAANFSPRVGCQSGAVASQYSFLTAMDRPLYHGYKEIHKATGYVPLHRKMNIAMPSFHFISRLMGKYKQHLLRKYQYKKSQEFCPC